VEKFASLNPGGVKLLVDRQVVARMALPLPTRSFDIVELTIGGDPAKAISDEDVDHLGGGRTAQIIWLTNAPIQDAYLAPLAQLRHLTRLYLGDTKVKGPGPGALASLGKLVTLSLDGLDLEASALDAVSRSKSLTTLGLSGSKLETSHLDRLGFMAGLETLSLANTTVGGRPLADGDLSRLAGLAKLKNLNVSYTAVTGTGLTALARARTLDALSLDDTNASTDEFGAIEFHNEERQPAGITLAAAGWLC
jgi:hypothetical protein